MRRRLLTLLCISISLHAVGGSSSLFLKKGWEALAIDNDAQAVFYFGKALEHAQTEKDANNKAQSLLYLGISTYGTSISRGLNYAIRASNEFEMLAKERPDLAMQGRSRCLQLASTIFSRRGNHKEAIALSREAMHGLPKAGDTTGTLGLIYNSLGTAYQKTGRMDSADFYFCKALEEHRQTNNLLYLPTAFSQVAEVELRKGNYEGSYQFFKNALSIARTTNNRQAQVTSLLGFNHWCIQLTNEMRHQKYSLQEISPSAFVMPQNLLEIAEQTLDTALVLSQGLADRTFKLKTLERILALEQQQGNYREALDIVTEINNIKDSIHAENRQSIIENLEVQFKVAEKERQLKIANQEKEIARLTAYMLWGAIAIVSAILIASTLFLRRINKKDKLLLQRKDELLSVQQALNRAQEEKHQLAGQRFQADLEHKESQLTALTVQMLQKTELLQELKAQLEKNSNTALDNNINKIINKGLNHDQEWADFNRYFESINKNFYTRLKQSYPEISPNDLKMCALIKMNLSIKEMASILNISPDSVKTARYRLRKKLRLNTEDNLTDFILQL